MIFKKFLTSSILSKSNANFIQLAALSSKQVGWKNATSIYDFNVLDIKGKETSLVKYTNFPCVIVNVASD